MPLSKKLVAVSTALVLSLSMMNSSIASPVAETQTTPSFLAETGAVSLNQTEMKAVQGECGGGWCVAAGIYLYEAGYLASIISPGAVVAVINGVKYGIDHLRR